MKPVAFEIFVGQSIHCLISDNVLVKNINHQQYCQQVSWIIANGVGWCLESPIDSGV